MKILDIVFKDLVRSSRSYFLIGMALVAPMLVTALIYFALGSMTGGDVSAFSMRVGVVNLDTLPADAHLETSLGQNIRDMFFDESVQSWITASDYADEAATRVALDTQEIGVAVIVPPSFTADYLAGNYQTPVTILQDPTLNIAPGVVRDMVISLLDGMAGGEIAYRVVDAQVRSNGGVLEPASIAGLVQQYGNWYIEFQRALFHTPEKAALVVTPLGTGDENTSSITRIMGMVLAGQLIFFSFFTGAYAMMSILQESEEGTLARVFTTPTRRAAILMGKFTAVFLTVLLQGLVLLIAGHLIFGVHWGNPGSITLALLGQMVASVGLAVMLVSFIKTSQQAGPIFGGALTGLGMISGLFTTNIAMPDAFNAIGNFTPQGWVLKAWERSLAGQPASELILPFVVLVIMGIVMFTVGALVFRKRFA